MSVVIMIVGMAVAIYALLNIRRYQNLGLKWKRPTQDLMHDIDDDSESGKLFHEMMKHCPSCHKRPPVYFMGPRGGINQNVFCSSCGQGYNVCDMVEISEPIHKDEKYITEKPGFSKGENNRG